MPFSLPIPAEANALLDRDPLALLIGMTLDQQMLEPGRNELGGSPVMVLPVQTVRRRARRSALSAGLS
ncbi:hypothetical protein [Dactylosporangium sp. NPDC005555]|uniref:hypothetical protein n=1 Tax=Dactylosporangium sp. NPDC005555 TaxID=3154889 RepID=UPI0033AB90A4